MSMERITIPRRLTQTAFFLLTGQWLIVGFLRCPFGVPFVSCASCPLQDCTGTFLQLPVLGLILLLGILVGRAFCGWVCPMGYLQDALARLPFLRLDRQRWFSSVEPLLRCLKYVALALVVWLVFHTNVPAERAHPYVVRSPSMLNWESIVIAGELGARRYPIRAAILALALLTGLLTNRFWCRYLCPLGGLLGVLNTIGLWLPRQVDAACRACGKYPRECIQHTTPASQDCVVCGDCLQGCPHNAITLQLKPVVRAALARTDETPQATPRG